MTEERKFIESAQLAANQKSLEQLFDYTKFHIQVYISLTAIYAGAINSKLIKVDPICAMLGVGAIMLAGLAGGVIASSITQTVGGSSEDFLRKKTGPFNCQWFAGRTWAYAEHTAFWIGLALVAWSLLTGANWSAPENIPL